LLLNLLYNFFIEDKSYDLDEYEGILNTLIGFLFAIFFIQIGKTIKTLLKLHYASTGIVLFLLSFYIVDKSLMIVLRNFSFKNTFIATLIAWILFFIIKKNADFKEIIYASLAYIFSFISLKIINENIPLATENFLTSDEKYFWLPVSTDIFEGSLLTSITSSSIQSYGLLVGHMHAVLNNIFTYSEKFFYLPAYKNLFFFLTIYFISECKSSKESKLLIITVLSIISLTSDWFTYLFFNSLLAESISSYFFGILVLEILKNNKNSFVLINLGFLYFSKQFISIFSIFVGLYVLYKYKDSLKKYFFLFFGLLIDLINSFLLKTPITWEFYLNSFESDAATKDGVNFQNIINIIVQFFIDKPMSYFLIISIAIAIYVNFKGGVYEVESLYIILLNTIFVFLLYVFVWTNVEYESSYRYLLNIFHIIIFYILITFDNFLNFKK